jgi:sugar lactone lactonase YvrE
MQSVLRACIVLLGCAASVACAATGGTVPRTPYSPDVAGFGAPSLAPFVAAAVHRDRAARYVYTCQNGTLFQCLVYDLHGKVVNTIGDGIESPIGIATDVAGNVYVANEFADDVTEYAPGGSGLIATLDNAGNVPIDVVASDGVVAVANLNSVTVFVGGATEPTRTLVIPNVLQASGVAFDSKGNCYVAFVKDTTGTAIDEYDGCNGAANQFDVKSGTPYNIAFDRSDNLYLPTRARIQRASTPARVSSNAT